MTTVVVLWTKGGLGDCGRHVLQHALRDPSVTVRAVARKADWENLWDKWDTTTTNALVPPDEASLGRLERVVLDVSDPSAEAELTKVMAGATAVVSCWGNRQPAWERVTAKGTANVVKAMEAAKVSRLVAMSSCGINEDWPPMRGFWAGPIFTCMLRTVLRSAYRDLSKAEKTIRQAQDIDHCIVRPTGVTPDLPPTGDWKTYPAHSVLRSGEIGKDDVGNFMLREALNPTIHNEAVTLTSVPKPK